MIASRAILALLLLVPLAPDVSPLEEVARDAEEAGLVALAFRARRDAALATGEPRPELPGGFDDPELSDRKREKLLDAYREARADVAAELGRRAENLASEGDADGARAAARLAVRLDRDEGRARAVLGQERVKGIGWVPADVARLWKRGRPPSEDGEIELVGESWRLRGNLEPRRLGELRGLLLAYREKWLDDWGGVLPLRRVDEPHEVLVFAREAEYASYLERTDPRHIRGVPGQYSPEKRRAAFFDVEGLRTGSNVTSSLAELMLHECTHQLMHELVDGRSANFEGDDASNFWLHEGLGEMYGMLVPGRDGLEWDRKAVGKMVRLDFLRENRDSTLSFAELDRVGRREYLGTDMRRRTVLYAQSGFVCLFLREEHPVAFRRIVRAAYCAENRPGLLTGETGIAAPKLEREFRKWFRRF